MASFGRFLRTDVLSTLRHAAGRWRRFAVRRLAQPVLGWGPSRRASLALARGRYRFDGPLGRLADRALITATPTAEERAASTDALVDLFFSLCSAVDIDVFVEAGAKEASASARAVELAIPDVVAFEANPYTHRRFVDDVTGAGVDYRHAALSDRAGPATFLVRRSVAGSPMADGQGSLLERSDHQPGYEEVTVAAVTLDHEVAGLGRVAMWVDVEGAVAEVFGGASRTLERTDVAIVEVEATERWLGQRWLASDVVDRLARSGLDVVARDMQSRWQFNILCVRNELIADSAVDNRVSAWRSPSPTR